MGVGYCIRCKSKVELKEAVQIYYKNGAPAERGLCSKCGSKVARILTTAERIELKAKQETKKDTNE